MSSLQYCWFVEDFCSRHGNELNGILIISTAFRNINNPQVGSAGSVFQVFDAVKQGRGLGL